MDLFSQTTPTNSGEIPGIISQLMFTITLLAILYMVLLFIEVLYKYINPRNTGN